MAKNSSVNLDITNNADGFDVSGGTTVRKTTFTGADITFTGSGTNTFTFPSATDTLVGRASTDTLTNKTINATSNTVSPVNDYSARAYLTNGSANQSISTSTDTKVQLDTKSWDPNSDFDSTTDYDYTAPVDGRYQVNAAVRYADPVADARYFCQIRVNGTTVSQGINQSSATTSVSTVVSDIVQLSASDVVTLYTFHDSGATEGIVFGSENTFLSIQLVSLE